MSRCRICGSSISPFMSFGRQPISNAFVMPEQFASEYFFELAPAFCTECHSFQIIDQPEAEQMFHGNYAYFASTSRYMCDHFKRFADDVSQRFLAGKADPFVVELGSNDGIMLRNFADAGVAHLGVEPSANVAQAARDRGVTTICEFFNDALAERIVAERGHADALLAANLMCHIPDLHSIAAGARRLLKPDGVMIFEDPYLGEMIAKTSYDQIYDEHVYIFSVASIRWLFDKHGMELFDVQPQITHGGSMRYFLAPKGSRPISPNVERQVAVERELGLHLPETYDRFRRNCEASRGELIALLTELKAQGKRVVGYGATAKGATAINYCGITPDLVEFISDVTPTKQGRFSPGAHIPVKPYDAFAADFPDYALLFAWNHKAEIMAKEEAYRAAGGQWIVYVPKVEVFS